jgi:uncharacterized protein DUF6799
MKKQIAFVAAFMIVLGSAAQDSHKHDPIKQEKYCASLKDGQVTLMHEGLPVTSEVELNDGGKVTPAGIVVKKSGNVVTLNNGDCIDKEGNVTNVNVPETPIKEGKK